MSEGRGINCAKCHRQAETPEGGGKGRGDCSKMLLNASNRKPISGLNCKNIKCLCVGCNLDQPAAAAKSLQSYPTLCDPIDGSPPGSPVPGIL